MSSEDSDDEPLAVLAAAKKSDPVKFREFLPETEIIFDRPPRKKIKNNQNNMVKKLPLTIKMDRKLKNEAPRSVTRRPEDVWLYLKDFNPNGPYSCLLCPEWFIGRPKVIIHYVLNHKKDFCGICRYFVPDRAAWESHMKFHMPWPCSQCFDSFDTETKLRDHLNDAHNLVHCRLCHFRLPANDQYHSHLLQKHNVTNVSNKDDEDLWELELEATNKEGSQTFLCLLCSKSNNLSSTFVNHFMGYHHITLKCFASIVGGRDLPFTVFGADLSSEFIASLKDQGKCGYVEQDDKKNIVKPELNNCEGGNVINNLLLEIKHEVLSETEEPKNEIENENEENTDTTKIKLQMIKSYKGDHDFDVTLMELVVINSFYYDYLKQALTDIKSNIVPENSNIDYEKAKTETVVEIDCSLCTAKPASVQAFVTHMYKMHSVKSVPIFSCRVCATTFETQNELESHITEELGGFEDLWMCQFCDKEFDNRESTRRHLTEHWELIEYDNCFSPHLGFKCQYCPTLFWNEPDREQHQIRVHMAKNKGQFYECECSEVFSDKIWFTYHYQLTHQKEPSEPIYLLKCCVCAVVLPTVDQMRSHFAAKHPEARKIFCSFDTCQYKPFSHRKSFQLHLRSQHATGRKDRVCTCSVCGREFPNVRARSAHAAQVHGTGKFKCKICKEMLHSIDERKLHYLLHHPGHHPFECSVCGKSFQYKSSLYIHKQDHLPNKQTYTCSYCQKVFAKKDSFREHVQIHEGPRHACSYCPMRFVQRSNMLRHERRHTGERPYACTHCDRTFSDKGACTSHVRTHSKEASYACLYCGQTFAQKSKLTYHIRKHTGENLETCPVCSKLFTSACALREHMKTHEDKRIGSVKCPLCDKTYRDERYMLRHLRTVHTGSNFSCPLCTKTLTSAVGLRHHVLTHSRLNLFRCKCCTKSYAVKRTIIKHLRRRHSLKASEVNIKDFYKKLEPRECQLDLTEEVMTSIFGPPKKLKAVNNILIGDFVTFANNLKFAKAGEEKIVDDKDDEETKRSGDDEQSDQESRESQSKDQTAIGEQELEPTDFVSVKIESIEEDENEVE